MMLKTINNKQILKALSKIIQ